MAASGALDDPEVPVSGAAAARRGLWRAAALFCAIWAGLFALDETFALADFVGGAMREIGDDGVKQVLLAIAATPIPAFFLWRCQADEARTERARRRRAEETARAADDRLASYCDLGLDAHWELDADLRYVYASHGWATLVAAPAETLLGRRPWDLPGLSESPAWRNVQAAMAARGRIRHALCPFPTPHGVRQLRIDAKPRIDSGGRLVGYYGTAADVTAEHSARERAEQAHGRLCDAMEQIPAAVLLFDQAGRLVLWNSQVGRVFAPLRDLLVAGTPYATIAMAAMERGLVEDWQNAQASFAAPGQATPPGESAMIRLRDGTWLQCIDRKMLDGGTVSIRIDVTVLKQHEQELEAQWRILRAALDSLTQGVLVFDERLELAAWNDQFFALLDYPPELKRVGATYEDFARYKAVRGRYGPGEVEDIVRQRIELVAAGRPFAADRVLPDGRALSVRGNPIPGGGVVFTCSDITARKRHEAEIRSKGRLLQAVFDHMGEGICVFDKAHRLTAWNEHGRSILALPEELADGAPFLDILRQTMEAGGLGADDPERHVSQHVAAVMRRSPTQVTHQRPNGEWVEVRYAPMPDGGFVASYRNVTETKRVQLQFQQSQKMEAIGQLAGGIAHEFNNLLTAIGGFSRMALRHVEDTEHVRECMDEVIAATDRSAGLTKQLLAFGRKQILTQSTVCLSELAAETAKMLKPLLGETIAIDLALADSGTTILVDPDQLSQAIMNLAVNGRDAMSDGGRLTIATRTAAVPPEIADRHPGLAHGACAVLEVIDTGCGMDADTAAHIFEPFFTTKDVGKGTGLGLAMVHGFVEQSNGAIAVDSAPGKGTTIRIFFPQAEAAAAAESAPSAPIETLAPMQAATVLLVEDEGAVRRYFQTELEDRGYAVLVADNGEEAVQVQAAHEDRIDIMVTDVVMPAMSGPEAARRIAEARPDMKVLYMSGYPRRDVRGRCEIALDAEFIEKPFSIEVLVQRIREVLDAADAPPAAILAAPAGAEARQPMEG